MGLVFLNLLFIKVGDFFEGIVLFFLRLLFVGVVICVGLFGVIFFLCFEFLDDMD